MEFPVGSIVVKAAGWTWPDFRPIQNAGAVDHVDVTLSARTIVLRILEARQRRKIGARRSRCLLPHRDPRGFTLIGIW
jgi:hypothetical protein